MFLFFKIPSLTEIINKYGYTTVKDPNNTAFVCIVNLTMKKRANHFPALLMLWNTASLFYISLLMNVYVFIWVSFMRQMLSSALSCTCCSIQWSHPKRMLVCHCSQHFIHWKTPAKGQSKSIQIFQCCCNQTSFGTQAVLL